MPRGKASEPTSDLRVSDPQVMEVIGENAETWKTQTPVAGGPVAETGDPGSRPVTRASFLLSREAPTDGRCSPLLLCAVTGFADLTS